MKQDTYYAYPDELRAVSYTHLDVYKRQGLQSMQDSKAFHSTILLC